LFAYNSDLFVRAVNPVTKQLLWNALQKGLKNPDSRTKDGRPFSNLAAAAQHIHNFLFDTPEIQDPSQSRSRADDPERKQFEEERKHFEQERFKDLSGETQRTIGSQLGNLIIDGLDPKNSLTPFIRNSIVDRVIEEIGSKLDKDSRHMAKMNSLWRRAKASGYPRAMANQIARAYLDSAKVLIPEIRNKIKSEALTGRFSPNGGKSKVRKQIPPGRGVSTSQVGSKRIDYSKTSDMDILEDRVTYRK
jgi:hypothetical protein